MIDKLGYMFLALVAAYWLGTSALMAMLEREMARQARKASEPK
jgi:hypothetical protein